jgi:hypothetical protein
VLAACFMLVFCLAYSLSSGQKNKPSKKEHETGSRALFATWFDTEDVGDMFFRNICWLLKYYTAVHHKNRTFHNHGCENIQSCKYDCLFLYIITFPTSWSFVHFQVQSIILLITMSLCAVYPKCANYSTPLKIIYSYLRYHANEHHIRNTQTDLASCFSSDLYFLRKTMLPSNMNIWKGTTVANGSNKEHGVINITLDFFTVTNYLKREKLLSCLFL